VPKDYIVGTVGAGDAFCAGMLYSFLNGYDVLKGMQLASCSAVCNLSAKNSVDGARALDKILEIENRFERRR
jgi:sugar/nucleoside kinase (ribokinase family)